MTNNSQPSGYSRQPTNQKQRSFSNDARLMLHDKRLEQRFAQNQAINSLDQSMALKISQNTMNVPLGGGGGGEKIGQGLYQAVNSNFNDVAEFEIYDRKFKQAVSN